MARSGSKHRPERAPAGTRVRLAAVFGVVAIVGVAMASFGGGTRPAPASASPAAALSATAGPSPTVDVQTIEPLLAYVRREYWEVYDADRAQATNDDLTSAKLDLILTGAGSPDSAISVRLLGQLTTTILNLSSKSMGLSTDGDPICGTGLTDITTVEGATELFGEPRPTIATVVANAIGAWNGQLTNDGRAWTFAYDATTVPIALAVLEGVNEGRLVTSSGC
jgi:hypothetical protein